MADATSKSQQPTRAKKSKRESGNTRGQKRSHLKDVFLKSYLKNGTIQSACVEIGITRNVVYKWLEEPAFKAEFNHVNEDLLEVYEGSAQYRGVTGVERLVLHKGKPVIDPRDPTGKKLLTYREFSDHCLEMLMAAKNPEKYGRRKAESLKVQIDIRMIQEVSSEMLNIIRRRVPAACPHCKNVLDITPAIAKDLELLSARFGSAT